MCMFISEMHCGPTAWPSAPCQLAPLYLDLFPWQWLDLQVAQVSGHSEALCSRSELSALLRHESRDSCPPPPPPPYPFNRLEDRSTTVPLALCRLVFQALNTFHYSIPPFHSDLSRPPSQNEGDNTKNCLRLARNAGDKELVYYSYSMCSKNSFNATCPVIVLYPIFLGGVL